MICTAVQCVILVVYEKVCLPDFGVSSLSCTFPDTGAIGMKGFLSFCMRATATPAAGSVCRR